MHLLKSVAIATGLYRPARLLHRALMSSERRSFREGIALYRQFVRRGDLCFDIGANIGNKTEMLLSLGASVVSVEPQPDLAREIKARGAHYGSRSIVLESAIGENEGNARLQLKQATALASLLDDWTGLTTGTLDVRVTTIDKLIECYGEPHFIKIDVEGYELQTLRGLSYRVPFVSLEYHCDERCAALARECIYLLRRHGSVEINATGGDGHSLLFGEWIRGQDFLARFPSCVAPHIYGDLIVRYAA